MDIEDPVGIIRDYRDKATGKTMAKSKWFFPNGDFEFRECEVLRYIEDEELYEVRWPNNKTTKKVSRFNLIFAMEDEPAFLKRIEEAKFYREDAELIMKYVYMVANQKTPKFELSDDEKTRISYLIASYRSYNEKVKDKLFRNPYEFLAKEAKDRYIIPSFDNFQKPSYND